MRKRGIRFLLVLAFGGILLLGAVNEMIPIAQNDKNRIRSGVKVKVEPETESISEDIEEAATEYGGHVSFSEYACLNNYRLIEQEILNYTTRELRDMGMCFYSEELKGEFIPVIPEDCSFPEELVITMEDIFYNSANCYERDKEDSYAKEKFRELGSEKFKAQSEDERNRMKQLWTDDKLLLDGFIDAYHFQLTEGTDNYLFVSYFESSEIKVGDVYLMEKVGDELVERNYFEIESCGGELIQYGGEFYFISWEENDRLDITEGIRIHRLNGNPKEETLCIRYWPDEYIWSDLPYYIYAEKAVCDYVEQLKKEFAQGRYLRREEEDFVTTEIYYGDEKDWESLELDEYGHMGYKVDIANCGLPVYIRKDVVRESHRSPESLETSFFYYDSMTNDFTELDEMSCSAKQLWFKEIGGKVYICKMDHICDFNYIFNMVLLEKDGEKVKSRLYYSATVVPRREFVVTEGPVNVTRR